MTNSDAYKFEKPVPVKNASGAVIGNYQIIRGAGNPEDPLYMMNVSDTKNKLVSTVMVMRSHSLLSRPGGDGKPDIAEMPHIPITYLTNTASVLIENRDKEFPEMAQAFATELDIIDSRTTQTSSQYLN